MRGVWEAVECGRRGGSVGVALAVDAAMSCVALGVSGTSFGCNGAVAIGTGFALEAVGVLGAGGWCKDTVPVDAHGVCRAGGGAGASGRNGLAVIGDALLAADTVIVRGACFGWARLADVVLTDLASGTVAIIGAAGCGLETEPLVAGFTRLALRIGGTLGHFDGAFTALTGLTHGAVRRRGAVGRGEQAVALVTGGPAFALGGVGARERALADHTLLGGGAVLVLATALGSSRVTYPVGSGVLACFASRTVGVFGTR